MPNNLKIEQSNQEDEYSFPYHYITQFANNQFKHYFLDTWSINYGTTIEYLLQEIDAGIGTRIVDIGCGDGRFTRELAFSFRFSTITGIDYSRRAIALASAMNLDISNLQFRTLDITKEHNLDVFDIAVLMEVFEHIPIEESRKFIQSVHSLLKIGGILYMTVPHENKPLEYKHFQHFSVETISNYLMPYFEITQIVPFERITWIRDLLLKILSNRIFILNNSLLLSRIYLWYKRNLFFCSSEKECQRIFIKAVAK